MFDNADLTALVCTSDHGSKLAAASLDSRPRQPEHHLHPQAGISGDGRDDDRGLLRKSSRFITAGISDKVTQDVEFLVARSTTTCPWTLRKQLRLFGTARSVAARIFTEREHNAAPAHCNVGNHFMAMQVIVEILSRPVHGDQRDQGVITGARLQARCVHSGEGFH